MVDIVDLECNADEMTPLARAADLENSQIISLLLDLGAQINKPSASSFALDSVTALHLAVIADNYVCVKLLLERGADIAALSRRRTALQEALNRRIVIPKIVKILLDFQSDTSILTDSQKKKLDAVLEMLENSERQKTSSPSISFDSNMKSPFSSPAPDVNSSPSTFSLGTETMSSAASPFSLGNLPASPFGSTSPKPTFDLPPIAPFGSPFSFGSPTAPAAPVSPVWNPFDFSQSKPKVDVTPNPFATLSPPSSSSSSQTSSSIPNPFG